MALWIRSMNRFTQGPLRACSQHLLDKNRHNPLVMTAEASLSDGWLLLLQGRHTSPGRCQTPSWYGPIIEQKIPTLRQHVASCSVVSVSESAVTSSSREQTACHLLCELSHMELFGCLMFTLFTSETLCSEMADNKRHFSWSMLLPCVMRELEALSLLFPLFSPSSFISSTSLFI